MLKPYILPILAGYIFYLVLTIFWGYMLARETPFIHEWLMLVLLPENTTLYHAATFAVDFCINLLLAIPFALAYLKLNSRQKIICLAVVVIPCFFYEYQYVFMNSAEVGDLLFSSVGFYYGLIVSLFLFPFSVWLTTLAKNRLDYNEA